MHPNDSIARRTTRRAGAACAAGRVGNRAVVPASAVLAAAVLALGAGCQKAEAPCAPGEVLRCVCPSGAVVPQACEAALAGEACACPSADVGAGSPGAGSTDCADCGGGPGAPDSGTGGEAPPEPPPAAPPGVPPAAPTGLVATAVGPEEIELHWEPAGADVAYRVYRAAELVATTAERAWQDKAVAPGTTFTYTVTASNAAGESARSAGATATTFAADRDAGTTAGELTSYATQQSLGFEWNIGGDPDHDATAKVLYRAAGALAWREAMPLMRVDFNGRNQLAGSVLFLEPGTEHDVVLHLSDPDGGARTRRLRMQTRPVPAVPTDGRTLHVTPGSGGGDGSEADPFRGVAAASAAARPGDVLLLHAGRYGGRVSFGVAGEPGRHVVWKAAGDGDPVFAGVEVTAPHMRLEGLRIEAGGGYDFPIGVRTQNAPADVAIVRCTIVGNHYAIWLDRGGSDWYVVDNVIVGDNTVASGSYSGEGFEAQHTTGHVVAWNRISRVADGVSYCDRNCDIHNNDIFDTSDDGVETDNAYANIRIWGNRMHNTGHNGVSFQPMAGAPWYVLRNQFIGQSETPLKLRGTDRFVFAHNTVVEWSNVEHIKGDQLLNAWSRNNVWVTLRGGTVFSLGTAAPGWRTSLDYDGFLLSGAPAPFLFGGAEYGSLAAFAAASGLERHGVELERSCFPTLDVPAPPPASVPSQVVGLAEGCAAVDAGQVLPNLNDGFVGAGPDLGAHERGAPPAHYGPR